jgi:hypothetical protein
VETPFEICAGSIPPAEPGAESVGEDLVLGQRKRSVARASTTQAAEAGAEENDRLPETPSEPHEPMDGWEDERVLDRNPPGAAEKGASNPEQD